MIIYDFDDTIYDGDSSVDFYKYCFVRKPISALLSFLNTALWVPLYSFKIITHREMKEKIFHFVRKFNNLEELVEDFWDINEHKIKKWYLKQKKKDDVIISASFDFIIKPMCSRLGLNNVLATDYDMKKGRIIGPNCHGKNKIVKFEAAFPKKKMKEAYSDSSVDKPILEYATKGFVVIGEKLIPYDEHTFEKKYINFILDHKFMSKTVTVLIGGIYFTLLTFVLNPIVISYLKASSIAYFTSLLILGLITYKYVFNPKNRLRDSLEYVFYGSVNFITILLTYYLIRIRLNTQFSITVLLCVIVYLTTNFYIIKYLLRRNNK